LSHGFSAERAALPCSCVPDRFALVAHVIEDDRRRVHASLIVVKDGGDIVRAATHRE